MRDYNQHFNKLSNLYWKLTRKQHQKASKVEQDGGTVYWIYGPWAQVSKVTKNKAILAEITELRRESMRLVA